VTTLSSDSPGGNVICLSWEEMADTSCSPLYDARSPKNLVKRSHHAARRFTLKSFRLRLPRRRMEWAEVKIKLGGNKSCSGILMYPY
jgi:hypothetical protein